MGVIGESCQPRNYCLRKPSRSAKAIPGSVVAIPTTIPKILAVIGDKRRQQGYYQHAKLF